MQGAVLSTALAYFDIFGSWVQKLQIHWRSSLLLFGVTEGHVRRVPSEPMTAAADTIVAVAFDMWVKMGEERRRSEDRGTR